MYTTKEDRDIWKKKKKKKKKKCSDW
jgi:hypothetical protein